MDFSYLVHPSPLNTLVRTTLHFLALGAFLFAAKLAISHVSVRQELIPLTVQVQSADSDAQVAKRIENEILHDQAMRFGWHENDPIARQHMLRNMRFVVGKDNTELNDAELLRQAVEMGMPKSDTIIRARLIQRARLSLEAVHEKQRPTAQDLQAYFDANQDEFMSEQTFTFAHVFFSRDKRKSRLLDDANELRDKLDANLDMNADDSFQLGDPLLRARATESRTIADAEATYGRGFASALKTAHVGQWSGPVESVFGAHLIRVIEKKAPSVPALTQIENRVHGKWMRQQKNINFKNRCARLRDRYDVSVVHVK